MARVRRTERTGAAAGQIVWRVGKYIRLSREDGNAVSEKVISYKVHKRTAVPEDEWYVVENAVPPIVSKEVFEAAQSLHQKDTRTPAGKQEVYMFAGLLRCADCKKGMFGESHRPGGRPLYGLEKR